MRVSAAVLAAGVAVAMAAAPATAADDKPPTLLGRAVLPSDAYQPGPPSGAFITGDNGVTPPFPGQRGPASAQSADGPTPAAAAAGARPTESVVRFATFNASLNRGTAGALRNDLSTPDNTQIRTIAEIVQRTRPDVLLVNEFDFDPQAADFADVPGPGNLRADYVLPSRNLDVTGAGVFWPASSDPLSRLTGTFPFPSSDHRPAWLDISPRR